jgi:hypothetical protein
MRNAFPKQRRVFNLIDIAATVRNTVSPIDKFIYLGERGMCNCVIHRWNGHAVGSDLSPANWSKNE